MKTLIKLTGAFLLIASSTAMGFMISRKLSIRVRFLQQYLQFVSYIETEIRYAHRVLSEIVSGYKNETEFNNFLTQLRENLKLKPDFSAVWQEAVHKIPNSYGLLTQDKEIINTLGKELGTTDVEGQIALCDLNKGLVSALLEGAKEEKQRKSKLYFMLSSSFGLCAAIVLL